MKIFVLLSALLSSTSPFVDSATYNCKVDGTFKTYEDNSNPLLPTSSEKTWAVARIRSSYNAVHKLCVPTQSKPCETSALDFDMTTATFNSFTYDRIAVADGEGEGESIPADASALRGSKKEEKEHLGFFRYFRYKFLNNQNKVSCSLCNQWDDDDALEAAVELDALDATATHSRWEAAWCDELRQGGKEVYKYVSDCDITLYACTLASANPNADGGGDAPEIKDVHPGPLAVGAGIEEIEAEAEAEIAAQELHND